jgi:hypothetical protein
MTRKMPQIRMHPGRRARSLGDQQFDRIIDAQASTGIWYAFAQPLGFIVFLVASFAEAARLPFDLPEAEQELVVICGIFTDKHNSLHVIRLDVVSNCDL